MWLDTEPYEPEEAEILNRIGERFGYLPHFFLMFAHKPGMNASLSDLESCITYGGSGLGRRKEELIAFWVSALNGCEYCMASHGEFLARVMKDEGAVIRLLQHGESGWHDESERHLLAFVSELTLAPEAVDEHSVAALKTLGLDDRQVTSIITLTAYFAFCNRMAQGTGLEVESHRRGWLNRLLEAREKGRFSGISSGR